MAILMILVTRILSAEVPVPVSPGAAQRVERIGSACPTFSWGGVAEARTYDLVVYRAEVGKGDVRGAERRLERVVSERMPGSALSWTPPLSRCLTPGGRYAWSIRAGVGESATEWSAPALFEVRAEPSREELAAALALVREYLESSEPMGASRERERDGERSTADLRTSMASAEGAESERQTVTASSAAAAAPLLSVDGGVVAASFSGDGSALSNVDARTLRGSAPSDFAPASHPHKDEDIPASIARDSEVAAGYLPKAGGVLSGGLIVQSQNLNLPNDFLFGDDIVVESTDGILGLYSSTAGAHGSALVLGETPPLSVFGTDKWTLVRETNSGGKDLKFTYGTDRDYTANETMLELGDDGTFDLPGKLRVASDGVVTAKGVPRAFAVVTKSGSLLPGSLNVDNVTNLGGGLYRVELSQPLLSCDDGRPSLPILATHAGAEYIGDVAQIRIVCSDSSKLLVASEEGGLADYDFGFSLVIW